MVRSLVRCSPIPETSPHGECPVLIYHQCCCDPMDDVTNQVICPAPAARSGERGRDGGASEAVWPGLKPYKKFSPATEQQ